MRIEYSDKIICTVRIKIFDKPGFLGKVATIVGDYGGMFGEIKTVHIGKDYKIRDLDIYTDDEKKFAEIVSAIDALDGIEILEIKDVVMEVHEGGKIEVSTPIEIETMDDLSIVYTPGVASVCRKIFEDRSLADRYTTIKKNVAIVTNGTAILGLGDIGPVAGMPVMEGKSLLLRILAGLNGIPILIDSKDPKVIVDTIKNISPTFGAIKLEDIKAPECFEIEKELDEILDIPVMHDDQHGTAVVVLAALINIGKYTFKNIRKSSVGILGLGAAGSGIQKLLMAYGIDKIYGFDINEEMVKRFVQRGGFETESVESLVKSVDIIIATTGCPGLIKKEWVKNGQIILALTNPDPEIKPEDAIAAGALFAADGKSVNNALAFPGIFKGALAANAYTINDAMKIAASETIAKFAMEGDLVPNILNKQVHESVALAVENAAYKSKAVK
ncbi:NAD-dependent malic enzyme [Deferribacter autotrophicus]|uniref:NAD-dependent malic enzyme n=1 Tax=Deferribacter autotrophicus TaxID=500465 RepID=A0A5A8F4Y2_9BACT|nr:malic enzyme-like NAD(P)-binding protein [Deferribacter autotrophicus]KAA0258546.1 NAD-dependent malic enzyme [Deferribacter autotrophicus]